MSNLCPTCNKWVNDPMHACAAPQAPPAEKHDREAKAQALNYANSQYNTRDFSWEVARRAFSVGFHNGQQDSNLALSAYRGERDADEPTK